MLVQSGTSIGDAISAIQANKGDCLLVCNGDRLVGILTERDILKAVATGAQLNETRISEVMTKDVVTVGPQTTIREAAKLMADRWFRHLPVVDGSKVIGVISQRDLAGILAGALNEPEALTALVESSELVRERRLKRIEHGVWD